MTEGTEVPNMQDFGNCPICQQAITSRIGTYEGSKGRYHSECLNCEYCKDPVQPSHAIQQFERDDHIPHHPPCKEKILTEQIKNKTITIKQGDLDDLMSIVECIKPNTELSVASNQQSAEVKFRQCKWFHEKTTDEMLLTLKRIETLAVCYHILLGKDKAKIEKSIASRAAKSFAEAEEYRKKQEDKKEKRHEKYVKQDPAVKQEMKSLKSLTDIGIPEDMARKMLEEMKLKKKVDDIQKVNGSSSTEVTQ